jgi:hypothetical protein
MLQMPAPERGPHEARQTESADSLFAMMLLKGEKCLSGQEYTSTGV